MDSILAKAAPGDADPLPVRDLRALSHSGLQAQLKGHVDRSLSRPEELWWIGAPGSLRGRALGVDSASNGTVCVSSAEDKEP